MLTSEPPLTSTSPTSTSTASFSTASFTTAAAMTPGTPKRPRTSSPPLPSIPPPPSTVTAPSSTSPLPPLSETLLPVSNTSSRAPDQPTLRLALRTFIYLVYDGVSSSAPFKDLARIIKALVDLSLDERLPPPHRADMSLTRKVTEFLIAPAISTLLWHIISSRRFPLFALALAFHRSARQALIYRLFFRLGTIQYSLLSFLGIICCFFHASIFRELVYLLRWPRHFARDQGLSAVLRTLVYAAAFAMPVHRFAPALAHPPRRRGNVKKVLFTLALALVQLLSRLRCALLVSSPPSKS